MRRAGRFLADAVWALIVAVAYIVAYFVMLSVVGWHPEPLNKGAPVQSPAAATQPAAH